MDSNDDLHVLAINSQMVNLTKKKNKEKREEECILREAEFSAIKSLKGRYFRSDYDFFGLLQTTTFSYTQLKKAQNKHEFVCFVVFSA